MYIPKHFEGNEAEGREIMKAHSWALLTTADDAGAPLCTHLALQWEDDGSPHLFAYRRAIIEVTP